MLGRVRSTVFEPALLITKLNWYPRKRRHSRWKLSQELKLKISFLPDYTHAKMAGRKRERYKIEPIISVKLLALVPFMLEFEYVSKIIKKLLVIKEICSWLQTFRPSNPGGSQEHTSVITNSFFNNFAFIFQFRHKGYWNSWLYFISFSFMTGHFCMCVIW